MNTDTSDWISYPKDTAGKKEAWWGELQLLGLPTEQVSDLMTVMRTCFSLLPESQPQDSHNWLWRVWVTSSGRGGPVEWLGTPPRWHRSCQEAGTGAAWPSGRAGGSSVGCTHSSGPAPDFLYALTCKFGQVPPCWKPCQWFLRWKNSSEIEKTFGLPQATGFSEKCQSHYRWPRDFGIIFFPEAERQCFSPHPDQSSCLLFQRVMMVFKSCCNSSVFVAKHPCPPCQTG